MKTIEDFKKQVKAKNIIKWFIHDCFMCGYKCKYLFKDEDVFYDSGCYCTNNERIELRTWEDVAKHYNMQDSPLIIKKMDKFWGFTQNDKQIIKETLISFKTAKLAKEKGLKGLKTTKWYYKDGTIHNSTKKKCWNTWKWTQGIRWTVITQSHLQQWLRKKHNYHISLIVNQNYNRYDFEVFHRDENDFFRFIFSANAWSVMPVGNKDFTETLEKALHDTLILIKL